MPKRRNDRTSVAPKGTHLGIPDWTVKIAYEKCGSLKGSALRWQFLRRHPAYRSAWDSWTRNPGDLEFVLSLERIFGLVAPIDPKTTRTPIFRQVVGIHVAYGADQAPRELKSLLRFIRDSARDGFMLACFDPSLSLEMNLDLIEEAYRGQVHMWQETLRMTRNRGPIGQYLRILDARATDPNLSFREIADHFSNEPASNPSETLVTEKRVADQWRAAKQFCEKTTGVEWPPEPKGRPKRIR